MEGSVRRRASRNGLEGDLADDERTSATPWSSSISQGLKSGRLCTLQGWDGKSASEAAVPPTHACFT